jgi:hypothetical protein
MERLNLNKSRQTEVKEQYWFKIVMNLRIPQNVGKFLVGERLEASQEGFSSMVLVS